MAVPVGDYWLLTLKNGDGLNLRPEQATIVHQQLDLDLAWVQCHDIAGSACRIRASEIVLLVQATEAQRQDDAEWRTAVRDERRRQRPWEVEG